LEVTELFAREGAAVAGCGRSQLRGAETLRVIEKAGGRGIFVVGNITKKADADRIVGDTLRKFGRIDVVVNNASILTAHEGGGTSLENLREVSTRRPTLTSSTPTSRACS